MNKNFVPFRIRTCRITQIRSCYLNLRSLPFFPCAVAVVAIQFRDFVWIANSDIPVSDLLAPCATTFAHLLCVCVSHCITYCPPDSLLLQLSYITCWNFSSQSICRQWKGTGMRKKKQNNNRKNTLSKSKRIICCIQCEIFILLMHFSVFSNSSFFPFLFFFFLSISPRCCLSVTF